MLYFLIKARKIAEAMGAPSGSAPRPPSYYSHSTTYELLLNTAQISRHR